MALLQADVYLNTLDRKVPLTVTLPADKPAREKWPDHRGMPYKTLYLLHGIYGDHMSWLAQSSVQRYADARNLALVMPAGENGFYLDHEEYFNRFGAYIAEIVDLTRQMFPLSVEREDTFLGGFSMGGYGALRNGLLYHELFGAVVAFSSALLIEEIHGKVPTGSVMDRRQYVEAIFGDTDSLPESDKNPAWLAKKLAGEKADIPALYLSCGEQDPLLDANKRFVHILRKEGIPVTFETAPGAHTWDFWDSQIRRVMDWLPLERPGVETE